MNDQQHKELVTEIVAFSREVSSLWNWFANKRVQAFANSTDSTGVVAHLRHIRRFNDFMQRKFSNSLSSLEDRYVDTKGKTALLPFADKKIYEEGFDETTDQIKSHPSWHERETP